MIQKPNTRKERNTSELTTEAANKITFNKNVLNNIETFQEPSPPNDTLILMAKFCMIKSNYIKHKAKHGQVLETKTCQLGMHIIPSYLKKNNLL